MITLSNTKKSILPFLLVLLTALTLMACGGSGSNDFTLVDVNPEDSRGKLINAELLASKNASFIIPYAVDAYKITYYTTDVKGERIKVSGLLSIPKKDFGEKSPLLSYQHGTIFLNAQAPSNSSTSASAIMKLAGTGYIVSAADYIGYGESSGQIHPYVHADSLANTSIDMLRASKTFLTSKQVRINDQLFLSGYSEGGYATLALQKSIQDKHSSEFIVTASVAGAGPFDLTETAKILANKITNEKPAYMSFLLKAYDVIYDLDNVSGMYQSQYVDTINTMFDGNHSTGTITDNLTTTTANLFNADFLEPLKGTSDHVIKEKLALNNLYDWKPTSPTRFYHGKNDEIVPYINSQKAVSTMKANGASDVSLVDCPLNTHVQCIIFYAPYTLNFFSKYASDL